MEEGLLPTNGSAFDLTSPLLPQLRPSLPSSSSLIGTSLEEESWEMKRGRGGGSPIHCSSPSAPHNQTRHRRSRPCMHTIPDRKVANKEKVFTNCKEKNS